MTKGECIAYLNDTIELIEEMKQILDDKSPDSPQALFEAYMDVQNRLGRVIHEAIRPLLTIR
jgi:hypothetical protein